MDPKAQRFSIYGVSLLFTWWTLLLISGFVYWEEIVNLRTFSACETNQVISFFAQIVEPQYWFGLFALLLTAHGAYVLFKKCTSRLPWLMDMKWLIFAIIIALMLLAPLVGCN